MQRLKQNLLGGAMPRLNRRTLLSTFGVAYMTPLITGCATSTQASKAGTRRVAVVPPGGNRFTYSTPRVSAGWPCKATAEDTAGGLSAFELGAPARFGPGLHVHHREDEWYYVVDGNFLFDAGDERHELGTGASIFLPRDIPHRWANNSTTSLGRLLLVCQPGGFERFFDELGKLPTKPTTDADMKTMHELAARFGLEMLGRPIFP